VAAAVVLGVAQAEAPDEALAPELDVVRVVVAPDAEQAVEPVEE
jgi:hypothetical protein